MKLYKKAFLPLEFSAGALACGLKKSGKLDLALFHSNLAAKACGMFTTNKIKAAPVKLCQNYLKKNKDFRAIIANSGNANCFTGKIGLADSYSTSLSAAKALGVRKDSVLVASTGIIGKRISLDKIKGAIPSLAANLSAKGIQDAAVAIMTTDIFSKEVTVKFSLGAKQVTVCGIAKGAGMIAPNMATMLSFIFTDANISYPALNKVLKECVEGSFNCITVDGCMSTNDTVIIMANGAAANKSINSGKDLELFKKALYMVCTELAKMIVRDGEGATKFIKIKVGKARNYKEAKCAALAVANSNLFKTAVYGENPNFGRIAAAIGASKAQACEEKLKVKVSSLKKHDINVEVILNTGKAEAIVYTSDLTPEYIKINAEYN